MSILSTLSAVLSGSIAHKNATNNLVIRELWARSEALTTAKKEIQSFVVAASVVAEFMFYEKSSPLNPKKLDVRQFRLFYDALLAFYCHSAQLDPQSCDPALHRGLLSTANDATTADELLRSLERGEEASLHQAANQVWTHLVAKGVGGMDFPSYTRFSAIAKSTANDVTRSSTA